MDTSIYFVLKDAGDRRYEGLRGHESAVAVLLENGYLEGDATAPRLTERGRNMRDVLGEIGVIAGRISVRKFNKYTMHEPIK